MLAPSIDEDRLACDVAGIFAHQIRGGGNLGRPAEPLHRNDRQVSGLADTAQRVVHAEEFRFRGAWGDRVPVTPVFASSSDHVRVKLINAAFDAAL
jgi:hypothetical protein